MATAKSKKSSTNEQVASGKKTASGGKRGAAARAPKRPPAFRKRTKKKRSTRGNVPGALLFFVGLLMLFCIVTNSNATVILLVRNLAKGAFGKLAVPMSLYLCALGVQVMMGNVWPLRGSISVAVLLALALLATLLQVFRMEDLMRLLYNSGYRQNYNGALWQSWQSSKNQALAGGSLGALLGYPLWKLMDVTGSAMVLIFAMAGLCVWIVRMFVPDAQGRLGNWLRERREEREADREALRQERSERDERDAALLVPLPDELLGEPVPDEEPARGRGKKKPAAPPPERYAPPVEDIPRVMPPIEPLPRAPLSRPQGANQPRLYIEDILPDGGGEPYFDDVDEKPRRKGFLPDFMAKRREKYDADYGAFEREYPENDYDPDEEYGSDEYAPDAFAPRESAARPAPRYSDDPGMPYREAFRAGRENTSYGEPLSERPAFQTDGDLQAAQSAWAQDESGYLPRGASAARDDFPPEDVAPATPPEEDMPAEAEVLPDDVEDAPVETDGAEDVDALETASDGEQPPWEEVAPAYDPQAEPSQPARRRRRESGYYPAGNVTQKIPEIPKEERLDRPDWKPPQAPEATVEEVVAKDVYRQPPFSLLERDDGAGRPDTREADARGAQKLEETLKSFGVEAHVIKVVHGPAITRYELQPAPGVKVSRITGLTDDIALNMAAVGVRIEAPIPGRAAIGIEIANDKIATVHLRDVLESDESIKHPSRLAVALGKDIAGKRIIADLARMPHLLIAGATGSGKSVCINTIIASIIYRSTPDEVRMILIDPKKVELSVYNGIPHLLVPVVTDAKKASGALSWAVTEMDERYKLFADCGVRDIRGYNAQRGDKPFMPSIVVIIDELSDLMLVAPGEVEESICRLAQLARACGIHLVIATQRPSVNVITGIIKANIPSRIAFAVSSQVDSRTILDGAGAEKLLGKGDMLFAPAGGGKPTRVQGCFVSDDEVQRVVEYVKDRHTSDYSQAVIDALSAEDTSDDAPADEDKNDAPFDSLFEQAVEMAVEAGQTSISMLQRRLRIGYARAGRIVDEMARRNLIGQADGAKPREVLITRDDLPMLFPKGHA